MAKIIRTTLSASGSVPRTIPGSEGSLNKESNQVDDSIFGQDFASQQPALIDWTIQSNAFYKGISGYLATLKKQGSPTAFTTDAMTVVAGTGDKTFEIDAATRSLWDRESAFTFFDSSVSGSIATSDIANVDYLFGRVTFETAHPTNSGQAITVSGKFIPLSALGAAQSFSLKQTADTIDITDLATAQANGGFRVHNATVLHVSLELTEFFSLAAAFFDTLSNRSTIIIELVPAGTVAISGSNLVTVGSSRARGYFKAVTQNQEGSFGGDEMETITFELNVPDTPTVAPAAAIAKPFGWVHAADSTLSQALQDILTVWQAKTSFGSVDYLPDGTSGSGTAALGGAAFVTDVSIAGDVNGINEFSISFQGSGALALI